MHTRACSMATVITSKLKANTALFIREISYVRGVALWSPLKMCLYIWNHNLWHSKCVCMCANRVCRHRHTSLLNSGYAMHTFKLEGTYSHNGNLCVYSARRLVCVIACHFRFLLMSLLKANNRIGARWPTFRSPTFNTCDENTCLWKAIVRTLLASACVCRCVRVWRCVRAYALAHNYDIRKVRGKWPERDVKIVTSTSQAYTNTQRPEETFTANPPTHKHENTRIHWQAVCKDVHSYSDSNTSHSSM